VHPDGLNLSASQEIAAPGITTQVFDAQRPVLLQVTAAERIDAPAWMRENAAWVEQELPRRGALLFRGFSVDSTVKLGEFAAALSNDFPHFAEESSPRRRLDAMVFTSTDYPHRFPIQMHNEHSYASVWPMKLFFGCIQPALRAGGTPVASSRAVLARLRPSTREAFRKRGVLYVRNYRRGLGVTWQDAFGTDNRALVDKYCADAGIRAEWLAGDGLRTEQRGTAILRHPRTGEEVWFNHGFFFNVLSVEPRELREALLEQDERELATQTYFGTGDRIPADVVEEVREAYALERVCFAWERGDVLLIDNMLTAHGREPFEGARQIAVVMAERCRRADLPGTTSESR
jgi:alpha-ketoglutarate-dependent taurine dioxygenase